MFSSREPENRAQLIVLKVGEKGSKGEFQITSIDFHPQNSVNAAAGRTVSKRVHLTINQHRHGNEITSVL